MEKTNSLQLAQHLRGKLPSLGKSLENELGRAGTCVG